MIDHIPAQDCVELEKSDRCRRIIQIDFACLDLSYQFFRQCSRIHFQSYSERLLWAHSRTDAAIFLTRDGFVELERITPEGFTAKRIETEDLSALFNQLLGMGANRAVVFRELFRRSLQSCPGLLGGTESRANQKTQSNQKSSE